MPSEDIPEGYTIIKTIGSGGSGRVYLAQQQSLGRHVALKLYSQDLGNDAERADFARECEAARQLGTSPFVVTLHEAGVAGRRPWIAMEYYPRGSLADLLHREGPVEPQVAVTLAIRLADALAALHGAGLFHGDIKPGNILLAEDGSPVLTDFGLSVIRQARSSMTLDAFSPPYAAPERLLDNRYAASSEVWGLGAVLYELLTGVPPFVLGRGESLVSFARRVSQDPLDTTRLAAVPPQLNDAIGLALAKDRTDRPGVEALAAALRATQAGLGWPEVPPPVADLADTTRSAATILRGPAALPGPPADALTQRRRPWLIPAAAAAAVVAVLAAGAYFFGIDRPDPRTVSSMQTPASSPAASGHPSASPTGPVSPAASPAVAAADATSGPAPGPNPNGGGSTARPAPTTAGPTPAPARPVGFAVFGAGVSTSGDLSAGLTVRVPVNDYNDLRGVALDAGLCDGRIEFDAQLTDPGVASAGYGFGFGPHGSAAGGEPSGWTLQLEWDGGRGGYYRREVQLPGQAAQATTTQPAPIGSGRWFHVRLTTVGNRATVAVDGTGLGTFDTGTPCGAPLLRVWGSAASFRALTIG